MCVGGVKEVWVKKGSDRHTSTHPACFVQTPPTLVPRRPLRVRLDKEFIPSLLLRTSPCSQRHGCREGLRILCVSVGSVCTCVCVSVHTWA